MKARMLELAKSSGEDKKKIVKLENKTSHLEEEKRRLEEEYSKLEEEKRRLEERLYSSGNLIINCNKKSR